MGAMTFEMVCGADFRQDEEVWVVLVLPGVDTDRMFMVKGIGQADGTLLVTPPAEILKQLAGKTFVAAVLGE